MSQLDESYLDSPHSAQNTRKAVVELGQTAYNDEAHKY